jgi:hypothetical protein
MYVSTLNTARLFLDCCKGSIWCGMKNFEPATCNEQQKANVCHHSNVQQHILN